MQWYIPAGYILSFLLATLTTLNVYAGACLGLLLAALPALPVLCPAIAKWFEPPPKPELPDPELPAIGLALPPLAGGVPGDPEVPDGKAASLEAAVAELVALDFQELFRRYGPCYALGCCTR